MRSIGGQYVSAMLKTIVLPFREGLDEKLLPPIGRRTRGGIERYRFFRLIAARNQPNGLTGLRLHVPDAVAHRLEIEDAIDEFRRMALKM